MTGNKDLIYLDLALENTVRSAIERGVGQLDMGACAFVGPLLQNLVRLPRPSPLKATASLWNLMRSLFVDWWQ
jgi:hypothetical protein